MKLLISDTFFYKHLLMKHLLLNLMLLLALPTLALTETPTFFSQDFSLLQNPEEFPSNGWQAHGVEAEPTGYAAELFTADGPAYRILTIGGMTMAMANTEFEGNAEADQWLISPEIEVPYDNAALLFTACAFANKGTDMGVGMNNFKLLLSDGGVAAEDFTQTLVETGIRGSATVEVTTKRLVVPVNGRKGEKVRVAFVVTGSGVGLTGFSDISMGQYILTADNFTPEVAPLGSSVTIDVNIGLKTPVECGFVDAVLTIDGKEASSQEYKKTFGSPTSYIMQMQRIIFEDAVILADDTPVSYSLTLTPRFEGAVPSVINGVISTPAATYPANVVIEEATATGCGFCPRGIAAMEYYYYTYPGSETQGQAIPIALHGYMNYLDPMSEGVESYLSALQAFDGTGGLPAAVFNRSTHGLDPSYMPEVEKQIEMRSYNKAEISVAQTDGSRMSLEVEIRNGYNTANRPLRLSAVMIENNVNGISSGYNQTNYYYSYTSSQLDAMYGPELIPYIKPFLADGELGMQTIPAAKMTYQHVARGIFPDFNGIPTQEEWISDEPEMFMLDFDIPATVQDLKNTAVVALVTDPSDGSIVASDIRYANDYASTDVKSITDSTPVKAWVADGNLHLLSFRPGTVNIYDVAGVKLLSENFGDGETILRLPSSGLTLISIHSDEGEIKFLKILL